jgi:hypothetical protein
VTAEACDDRTAAGPRRLQVGDIARAHGDALRDRYALSPEQHAVLRALERCRTAALGGHLHVCERCGLSIPMYNSCRNRHCPTCQSLEQHKWLERRRERILPAPYFHVVFTLPEELRPIVACNRERLFGMLFDAASSSLLTLAKDPKRLGALPAITMVLHTWTRQLAFHPHVHAIVSAGGLSDDGVWVPSRADYLFPVRVIARLFRRLFRTMLLEAIDEGEIAVPAGALEPMRTALFETKWNVYAKAPFGGAEHVFAYLGRYTHRVGLSNARLRRFDERSVTFATKNGRTCTLEPVEFLRRFLLHVLPGGFHKIRHYGLCSSHHVAAGTFELARAAIDRTSTSIPEAKPARALREDATTPTWVELMLALTGLELLRCPRCGASPMRREPLPDATTPVYRDTS